MPVAFDAVGPNSSGQSNVGATGLSWFHTCSGLNRLVIVALAVGKSPDTSVVPSANYDGVAMTRLATVHANNGTSGLISVFYMVNPPIGSKQVTVGCGVTADVIGGSASYTGVNQSTPIRNLATGFGVVNNAPFSVKLPVSIGNMAGFAACGGNSLSLVTRQQRWINNLNSNTGAANAAYSDTAGSPFVSGGWSISASDSYGIIGFEIVSDDNIPLRAGRKTPVWERIVGTPPGAGGSTYNSSLALAIATSISDAANLSAVGASSFSVALSLSDSASMIANATSAISAVCALTSQGTLNINS